MIDPSIFKAYDIRGHLSTQIDGEVARRVGCAFIDYLGARRIALGRDVRASSPEIAAGFIARRPQPGLPGRRHRHGGHGHAVLRGGRRDLDGGAIITASHNPKEWNGIKMVRKGALALSGDAGIKEIKEALVAGRFADDAGGVGPPPCDAGRSATTTRSHCLSFIDVSKVRAAQGRPGHRQRHGRGGRRAPSSRACPSRPCACTSSWTARSPTTRRTRSRRRTAARSWRA